MISKALPMWLYVLVSFAVLANRAWSTENDVAHAPAARNAAADYLRSMPDHTKIYVWPTWRRPYEIIGDNYNMHGSVERYKALRGDLSGLYPAFRTAQIAIIADNSNRQDLASVIAGSHLLPWYKDFVANSELNTDRCTAYKFTSRGTWASVGVILVNEVHFHETDAAALDRCIFAALDYLQGFPTRDGYFNYLTIPDATVRGVVIEAIYQCAAEADDNTRERIERTRDGLTPLPSLDCILAKIAE